MTDDELELKIHPLDRVAEAAWEHREAKANYEQAIRQAVKDGARVVEVAEAAGVSRNEVYRQLRRG